MEVPVALDEDNPNAAYQLGRLFAVLEGAQYAALGACASNRGWA
jgi:CRISPR-associated protein Csd1